MATSKSVRPRGGSTSWTGEKGASIPASWQMMDSAGNHWYLWFDTSGRLRKTDAATFEAANFNFNTGGVFISGQLGGVGGAYGQASQAYTLLSTKEGIVDTVATSVVTFTVPNGNHTFAAMITILASLDGTDSDESARVATGTLVGARTVGVNLVAAVSAIAQAQIATVAAGATLTLAYGVSAVAGAVGASNTVDLQVILTKTGGANTHKCIVLVELINTETTGVTMAAA